jgi:transcriptional regulator with XRE-family HTH domain
MDARIQDLISPQDEAETPQAFLGRRLSERRRKLGRTLKEVADAAGLSISTLSRIENGLLSVTYDKMRGLAGALGIDVVDLLDRAETAAPTARRSIMGPGQGDIYDTGVYRYEMRHTDLSRRKMSPIVATLKCGSIGAFGPLKRHPGEEFFFVLKGEVELHCEHYAPARLAAGHSAYFDSTMGHALLAADGGDAEIVWVCTEL